MHHPADARGRVGAQRGELCRGSLPALGDSAAQFVDFKPQSWPSKELAAIHLASLKGARQDGGGGLQRHVLRDQAFRRNHSLPYTRQPADTKRHRPSAHSRGQAVDRTVYEQLEHKASFERLMKIVETDVDPIDAAHRRDVVDRRSGFSRLQQSNNASAAVRGAHQMLEFVRPAKHRQHQMIRAARYGFLDFAAGRIAPRIESDEQLSRRNCGTYSCDVIEGVTADDARATPLTLVFSLDFEIDEHEVDP